MSSELVKFFSFQTVSNTLRQFFFLFPICCKALNLSPLSAEESDSDSDSNTNNTSNKDESSVVPKNKGLVDACNSSLVVPEDEY